MVRPRRRHLFINLDLEIGRMILGAQKPTGNLKSMSFFEALGIDHTIILQFVLFSIAFFSLAFGLFKPYVAALELREKKTTGSQTAALGLKDEAQDLKKNYEQKARELSSDIKTVFDTYRGEAQRESEKIIAKARSQSQALIDESRSRIAKELAEAQKKLKDEIPSITQLIVSKLLSKKV
ncbi:MAG: hypothetical protein C5B49_00375 [Bdellovibrio sp.]|nr:MAG: hypothetical protein C5B49_00375 [Bdellovibrio sp.]